MSKVKLFCIIGFFWTAAAGVILHFTYDWSGGNSFVGLFSAVNESIWEHMKLLFFPIFAVSAAAYPFFRRKYPPFLTCCAFAAVAAMFFQTSAYYTYSGIAGKDIAWVNIAIFFVSAALWSVLSFYLIMKNIKTGSLWGLAIFCGISVCFFYFTNNYPDLGIFREPFQTAVTQLSFNL